MAENINSPEIRFEGFTDPWEQRKLGDFASKKTSKNSSLAFRETFTNSAERGVVSQLDYFDHDVTNAESIGGYYVVKPDDFVYNPRISIAAPVGPINRNRLGRAGVMSPLYTVFEADESMDKFYLEHFFKTRIWHRFMFLEGNSGARSDRFSIGDEMFFGMPIACPLLEEQRAIADHLESMDSLITLHQRKSLVLANAWMTAWEQRKLGELCEFAKGHGYSKTDVCDAGMPIILYGRLYTQYQMRIEDVDTFAVEQEGSLISKGNEVIVPASGETAEDIAVASSVRSSGIILGGDLNVLTPGSELDPEYTALGITYSKAHNDLAKRAQGKSVVHIHGSDIADVDFAYPSIEEQQAISSAVLKLDSLITLHQCECFRILVNRDPPQNRYSCNKYASQVDDCEAYFNSTRSNRLNKHPIEHRFLHLHELFVLTLMKGDEGIQMREEGADLTLLREGWDH